MKRGRFGPATRVAVVIVALSSGAAGCQGPDSGPGPGDAAEAAPLENCPATLEKTIGAACTMNGLVCGPTIRCGVTDVTISCECAEGVFRCLDAVGNPIATASEATCPVVVEAGACPRSEKAATLAACSDPGLLCQYPSACAGMYDQCQCFPGPTGDGGFGLRFDCPPVRCTNPDAAVITFDAGLDAPAAADSTSNADATSDAPRGPDAADTADVTAADASAADGRSPAMDDGGGESAD